MGANFILTPDAKNFVARMKATVDSFPRRADKAVQSIVKEVVKTVENTVLTQNFDRGAPLTRAWAARKARLGMDPRTLIATQAYLRSYRTLKLGNAHYAVTCDVDKMKRLEFGVKGKPGRPHLEPVLLAMRSAAPAMFVREVLQDLMGKSE